MNQILFGLIGMLMLAITGVGFADVKSRVDAGTEITVRAQEETTTALSTNTVAGALAEATNKVIDAIDDVTFGRSHDDGDNDEDDEDEEDEENEDGRALRTSARADTTVTTPATASAPTNTSTSNVQTYTMAQVAVHNSASSCYSAINGSVYNLTSFISQHPGGQATIKSLCGVNGTTAFNSQHGGQGRPASELASLKIGVLAN